MDLVKRYCIDCGKYFEMQYGCMKRRHFRAGEPICKSCYFKISKGGKHLSDTYPEEFRKFLHLDIVDYKDIVNFMDKLKTKKKIRFDCEVCHREDIMSLNKMTRRTCCGIKPICRKCSLKFATNSEGWRNNNSKAQFIAQNRPDVKEKQRNSQLKLMAGDPMYAEKRCSKSYVSGYIRGEKFDSSWELYFIAYCWKSDDIVSISRCKDILNYIDASGVGRKYYPDFLVSFKNGTTKVIEIKGSTKYNNFLEKTNAAREKYGYNYLVIDEHDLQKMGILFKRESYLKEFFREYLSEIQFFDNEKTRNLRKRIEQWQK